MYTITWFLDIEIENFRTKVRAVYSCTRTVQYCTHEGIEYFRKYESTFESTFEGKFRLYVESIFLHSVRVAVV
jgi:hypothetical protein